MFKVEFHIIHEVCLVNELSRTFPRLRFICPGGFVTEPSSVSELIVLDRPRDEDVKAVMGFFHGRPEIEQVLLLEHTADKAFIYFTSSRLPDAFCSKIVEQNQCFPVGMEIQEDGLEKWTVGCLERCQAEQLLKDLAPLGQIEHACISQASWETLIKSRQGE